MIFCAKFFVQSGLAARCLVQLLYAIGVAKPLSLFVECCGLERHGLSADDITNVLKIEFEGDQRYATNNFVLGPPPRASKGSAGDSSRGGGEILSLHDSSLLSHWSCACVEACRFLSRL